MSLHDPHPDAAILSMFHDGEGPEELRRGVEEHLLECDSCRRALEALRTISKEIVELPELPAPPSILEGVRREMFPPPVLPRWLGAAAAILVLAALPLSWWLLGGSGGIGPGERTVAREGEKGGEDAPPHAGAPAPAIPERLGALPGTMAQREAYEEPEEERPKGRAPVKRKLVSGEIPSTSDGTLGGGKEPVESLQRRRALRGAQADLGVEVEDTVAGGEEPPPRSTRPSGDGEEIALLGDEARRPAGKGTRGDPGTQRVPPAEQLDKKLSDPAVRDAVRPESSTPRRHRRAFGKEVHAPPSGGRAAPGAAGRKGERPPVTPPTLLRFLPDLSEEAMTGETLCLAITVPALDGEVLARLERRLLGAAAVSGGGSGKLAGPRDEAGEGTAPPRRGQPSPGWEYTTRWIPLAEFLRGDRETRIAAFEIEIEIDRLADLGAAARAWQAEQAPSLEESSTKRFLDDFLKKGRSGEQRPLTARTARPSTEPQPAPGDPRAGGGEGLAAREREEGAAASAPAHPRRLKVLILLGPCAARDPDGNGERTREPRDER
ncbi:MAG: anti-sigma factor family protein [Planctomycetota bacterium]